jgi:hypothetical protein
VCCFVYIRVISCLEIEQNPNNSATTPQTNTTSDQQRENTTSPHIPRLTPLHPTSKPQPPPETKMRTSITSSLALMLGQCLATINIGVAHYNNDANHQDHAAWIDGQDACQYAFLGPNSQNPCEFNGGFFTLSNGVQFRLTGCGSDNFCITNADGSLNSCGRDNRFPNAGRGCVNSFGQYSVDQVTTFG